MISPAASHMESLPFCSLCFCQELHMALPSFYSSLCLFWCFSSVMTPPMGDHWVSTLPYYDQSLPFFLAYWFIRLDLMFVSMCRTLSHTMCFFSSAIRKMWSPQCHQNHREWKKSSVRISNISKCAHTAPVCHSVGQQSWQLRDLWENKVTLMDQKET